MLFLHIPSCQSFILVVHLLSFLRAVCPVHLHLACFIVLMMSLTPFFCRISVHHTWLLCSSWLWMQHYLPLIFPLILHSSGSHFGFYSFPGHLLGGPTWDHWPVSTGREGLGAVPICLSFHPDCYGRYGHLQWHQRVSMELFYSRFNLFFIFYSDCSAW